MGRLRGRGAAAARDRATALKGGWDLFAARHGGADALKAAKSILVWAGGLSLLLWFVLVLITGAGLFQWGSESGEMAVAKAFALGTTSALTILFVWERATSGRFGVIHGKVPMAGT